MQDASCVHQASNLAVVPLRCRPSESVSTLGACKYWASLPVFLKLHFAAHMTVVHSRAQTSESGLSSTDLPHPLLRVVLVIQLPNWIRSI
eukprot:2382077-Amphidinium_carterae.1